MKIRKTVAIIEFIKYHWRFLVILLTPLILLPMTVNGNKSLQCAYIIAIVAIFWITEVMKLAVTSLIPIVLFPAFGILTPKDVAACYMKDITLMLIGGLIVAKTIEKQNLHRRLALRILKFMGPNPIFQYLGFMLSTWFLSMWISNTATTAMMITLADAVVDQWQYLEEFNPESSENTLSVERSDATSIEMQTMTKSISEEEVEKFEKKKKHNLGKGLFLSIAYAASCGGIATLPGTAPNLVFYGFMEERYGSNPNINFGTFMLFSFPVSVIVVTIAWILLCVRYVGISSILKRKVNPVRDKKTANLIDEEIKSLGPISFGEISTLIVFVGLVLLWVLREPGIPLWGKLFIYKDKKGKEIKYWSDAVSAIVATLLVFNLPAKNPFKHKSREKLMDWKYIEKGFSWGIVFLFGAGFALAAGCEKSGLSAIIGEVLTSLKNLNHYLIILIISLGISFLTEITSNTATATILLPVMLKMAECIRMHPVKIGLAVTISCSFSFCLPAATPPNAIVFSTGKLRVIDMASSGFILNFLCVLVLSVMAYYYSIPIFHTDVFPNWVKANCTTN